MGLISRVSSRTYRHAHTPMHRLLWHFTGRPFRYIMKNPKWNIPKFMLAGYCINKVYTHARADALAFEKIRTDIQRSIKDGGQKSLSHLDTVHWHLKPVKSILVIMNPAASGGQCGKHFDRMIEPILQVSGYDIHVHKTRGQKDARDQAKVLLDDAFSAIIVIGGDGTVSEVVSGISARD